MLRVSMSSVREAVNSEFLSRKVQRSSEAVSKRSMWHETCENAEEDGE